MLFIYISATVQANIFKLSNGLSRVSHIEVKNQIQNLTNDMNISLPVIACSNFFFLVGWVSLQLYIVIFVLLNDDVELK